jgi:hypothetical protein
MLAVFCLRLTAGLLACLPLLPAAEVHPRYYRTHHAIVLGLCVLAGASLWGAAPAGLLALLGGAAVTALAGVVVYTLEGAPGGRLLTLAGVGLLVASLLWQETGSGPHLLGSLSSAALLGSALSAMLMGHYYLISPGMSLRPLLRLLDVLGAAVLLRLCVDGYALWAWKSGHAWSSLRGDALLWLPVRWGLGLVLPLVLGWMAWESARIRSTQSATGILYVVVIFCFVGELTSQLLRDGGLAL